MEKKIAHYPLSDVKALVQKGSVQATRSALEGAALLGFSFNDMKEVVKNLEVGDLYKSMTSYHDNSIWQDVYHYPAEEGDIYLKLQIVGNVVIVSFKEL
jgi:motility quorum-sensing regulator / GCU-specific mRNA interferase toxin